MEYLEKSLVCGGGEYLLMKEFLKNNLSLQVFVYFVFHSVMLHLATFTMTICVFFFFWTLQYVFLLSKI